MSDLADAMPEERERIAGSLRPIEYDLTADHWYRPDAVQLATDAVLPVVADLITEAEKCGAVKALRTIADRLQSNGLITLPSAPFVLRAEADRIESGEVTP